MRTANLLYLKEHYAPITSVSRLFSNITKHREQKHFYLRCTFEDILMRHQTQCSREDYMSVLHVLPLTDSQDCELRFSAFRNSTCAPFVIYADYESNLKPIDKVTNATTYYQQHELCSAAALLVSTISAIYNTCAIFTGKNALSEFLNQLINWETDCIEHLKRNAPMNKLTKQQQTDYNNAKQCYLCRRDFQVPENSKGGKFRDHDHFTGHFLGAAHNVCNLNRPVKYQIPIFFITFEDTILI